jgi:putative Holliday junction resolvase
MLRYLGVDYGTKRIGLAISEPAGGIVSPLKMVNASDQMDANVKTILEMADEYGADGIVLGLPLNMDGTEGSQAKLSKQLAEAIQEAAPGLRVHLYDERLTSHAADQRLIGRDLTHAGKKARRDAVAAQILLESFLECGGHRDQD